MSDHDARALVENRIAQAVWKQVSHCTTSEARAAATRIMKDESILEALRALDAAQGEREDAAYEVAHWIAMEARVTEALNKNVAPIVQEGARRITALFTAPAQPEGERWCGCGDKLRPEDGDECWICASTCDPEQPETPNPDSNG